MDILQKYNQTNLFGKYLDLKLSNECNLKCRMCSYVSSHLIGAEMKQIEEA